MILTNIISSLIINKNYFSSFKHSKMDYSKINPYTVWSVSAELCQVIYSVRCHVRVHTVVTPLGCLTVVAAHHRCIPLEDILAITSHLLQHWGSLYTETYVMSLPKLYTQRININYYVLCTRREFFCLLIHLYVISEIPLVFLHRLSCDIF